VRKTTFLGASSLLLLLPMQQLVSQTPDSITSARAEDVLARVRRLTTNDVSSARQVVDSLVNALPSNAAAMPSALFAKASIAPSAADAERGYQRIVNDYRFAPQVPDALMRLALLESARNNRTGALRHLDRLLRDHSDAPVRSRASLMAGRMRMDGNDPARACELLAAAYASAGATERDVRDQAATVGAKCPTPVPIMAERDPPPMGVVRAAREVAVASVVSPVSVPASRRARRDTTPKPVVAAPVRRDTTPKPIVATPVRRDTTPKPIVATPVRRDTTPKPAVVASVRRDSTPKPAVVATVRRDSVPKPVVAAPVRPDSTPKPIVKRDTTPPAKPAVAAVIRRDTAPAPKPVAATPRVDTAATPRATAGRFGVQFAAYNDRPSAEQYATILRSRGITARVEGLVAPFRVRAGRFTTRAEAEASAALWRRPGTAAIVVALGPTP
jgi:SPOR domain